ncbi:MAG: cobalamin biosynthesis protein CobQ [Clostridiales bacterium]|nr:cobalamin biosynthesis protein CobQ [Clostridiales bacterium]
MTYKFSKVTALVGYYGCGKTNLAANLALEMSKSGKVTVVDIDIVNPYFRTADFKDEFKKHGISLVTTEYANTNLDIPVLNFDIASISENSDYVIIDVGGGSDGAAALGRYHTVLEEKNTQILYVFNMYQGLSAEETAQSMREIEHACRMKCTALVNNSNLGTMTEPEDILKSKSFEDELVNITGLDVAMRCATKQMFTTCSEDLCVERMVRMPWEEI